MMVCVVSIVNYMTHSKLPKKSLNYPYGVAVWLFTVHTGVGVHISILRGVYSSGFVLLATREDEWNKKVESDKIFWDQAVDARVLSLP